MLSNSAFDFEKTSRDLKKKLMFEKLRALIVIIGLVVGSGLIIYYLI